jgi:DNA polymerase-3 subunit gamma/tau
MLGTVDRGRVFQLAIALAEANAADVMALIAQMAEHAVDFNNLLADLIGLIHRIAIAQAVPDAVDNSQGDKEQVMALAQAMSPSMVQLLYQVALTGKRDLPIAPDPRAGMEMTMLRMLNFAPIGRQVEAGSPPSGIGAPPAKKPDLAHLKRQIVNSVARGSHGNADAPEIENPIVQSAVIESAAIESAAEVPAHQPTVAEQADEPPFDMDMPSYQPASSTDPAPVVQEQGQSVEQAIIPPEPVVQAPEPVEQAAITPEPVAVKPEPVSPEPQIVEPTVQPEADEPVVEKQEIMDLSPASWALVFDHLQVEGMLRNLVANSCLIQMDGNQLLFHGDSGHMRLFSASHQQRFNEILNEALGKQYTLQVIDGPLLHETPAQRAQRLMAQKQKAAVESIENDPNVMAIRHAFDAMVIMESITPLH